MPDFYSKRKDQVLKTIKENQHMQHDNTPRLKELKLSNDESIFDLPPEAIVMVHAKTLLAIETKYRRVQNKVKTYRKVIKAQQSAIDARNRELANLRNAG